MSILTDITARIFSAPAYVGSPPTGTKMPYVVTAPLNIGDLDLSVAGEAVDWDHQYSLYCAGASPEASYNLAMMVMGELQGARVGGTTLSTSMGYVGAQVEGHYESQVTVQLNQGGI